MNSVTSPPPDKSAAAVAKLLERTRSINIRPDPEDAPAAPVTAPVAAAAPAAAARPVVVDASTSVPVAAVDAQPDASNEPKRENRPRRKPTDNNRTLNRTFDIVTGPSTRALTVRIREDVHARLVLVATGNRLGRTGQASTLNELIAEGIEHVLERYDAA